MPLYDVRCPKCEKIQEVFHKMTEEHPLCECGGQTEVVLNSRGRDWFTPHWNENIDEKPIYIESKKQYREECKKRGLTARCLL
jgi:putative FmdB family regulatory protein